MSSTFYPAVSPEVTEEWAVYVLDLMTQTPVGEILWSGNLTFTSVLNDAGNLSCTVSVPQNTQAGQDMSPLIASMMVTWTSVWVVVLNGQVVWAGPVVQTSYDAMTRTWSVTCKEYCAWYDLRVLRLGLQTAVAADLLLDVALWYTQGDSQTNTIGFQIIDPFDTDFFDVSGSSGSSELTISSFGTSGLDHWLNAIGGQCGGGIGIPVPLYLDTLTTDLPVPAGTHITEITTTTVYLSHTLTADYSGTPEGLTFGVAPPITPNYPTDQFQTISSIIQDVTSEMEDVGGGGVEFIIRPAWKDGGWALYLPVIIAYARLGLWYYATTCVIDIDTCLNWTWPIDATSQANDVIEMGAAVTQINPTTPNNQQFAEASHLAGVGSFGETSGTPLLEKVETHSEVGNVSILQYIANHDVFTLQNGIITPTATFRGGGQPGLLSYNIGDDVRVVSLPNEFFSNGYDSLSDTPNHFWRIIQHEVTVPDSGPSSVVATLNKPPMGSITSAPTTDFTEDEAGTFLVTSAGVPAPSLSRSGSLPSGLSFTDNGDGTGTLTGTPAADTGGTYDITWTLNNDESPYATQPFALVVGGPGSTPTEATFTSANSTTFTVGSFRTFTVTTTGGDPIPTMSHSGASLPSGVTFVDNGNGTATLSGTPASGTDSGSPYDLIFTATNTAGAPTQDFTLTVVVSTGPFTLDVSVLDGSDTLT